MIAALPFAAAEAAGALLDAGVHPWRARRPLPAKRAARSPRRTCCSRWRCSPSPTGRASSPSPPGASYLAWPIGRAPPSAAQLVGVGAQLVATAVSLAAPALAAMLVAELALALVGRVQPALGRAVDAAPLRALAVLLVAAAAVYAGAHALAPTMSAAAHLEAAP